tara:strand:+ start:203 stop:1225 length:1023 start_codon:yes stop_codon:yes gene_type:complete
MSKILVLKNDRAGDLFTSLELISTLIRDEKNVKIYLSELNNSFNFFFKNIEFKTINFNLKLRDKIIILKDIFLNKYDKIYILTPKSFYFYLPIFFKKTKFYGIVYNGKKRNRPNKYLRKFLYKYEIVKRNEQNHFSYKQLQEKLLDKSIKIDNNFSNLYIPQINNNFTKLIPQKYIFFQFRYKFFEELNWKINEFKIFINFLKQRYDNVLFCSDIEKNLKTNFYNDYFEKNYSIIDLNNNHRTKKTNCNNIFFLKELSGLDMFHIIKNSSISIGKEGIVSHISFHHKVKCHNLFNFKLKNRDDVVHQKISYSEWCKGMKFGFSFLNKDIYKAIKKINNQI